jgi:hypothetical protein
MKKWKSREKPPWFVLRPLWGVPSSAPKAHQNRRASKLDQGQLACDLVGSGGCLRGGRGARSV